VKRSLLTGCGVAALLLLPGQARADGPTSVNLVATVADQLAAHATNIATTEGVTFGGAIATFTDTNRSRPASAFTATLAWGDGTTSTGTVSGSSGSFSVTASHSYAEEGTYSWVVNVLESPDGYSASAGGTITAADAALTAAGRQLQSGKSVDAVVATFQDADPGGRVSDYRATISWGDGSRSSQGSISAAGSGFAVTGSHQYQHAGSYTIRIAIVDAGGAFTTTTTSASIRGT
jgi:hypothetical protein